MGIHRQTMLSPRLICLVVATLCLITVHSRVVDVSAPVRPNEKSTRQWEKAAADQEDNEMERIRVREMGGSDTALVNVLDGTVEDGKIHPVGDRTTGVAMANLTETAETFLKKMGRDATGENMEKMVYWLHQGSGHYCDACKFMMEESHRRVLNIAQKKIRSNDDTGKRAKAFEGGAGHELTVNDDMKKEIAGVCESQQYANANVDGRHWCKSVMTGPRRAQIFGALTSGSFGFEDLLKRQAAVCGPQVLNVCKPKPWLGSGLSDCRACAEAFQDFDRLLQQDRRDIDVGSLGVKAHKKSVSPADRQFRGRHHVWQKSQELCTTVQQRHPAKAASVIQEMCEEVLEEYESQVIRAFVEGGHQHPGASAEQVCVTIAEKCDADEFEKIKPELQSYHATDYPFTQPMDAPKQQGGAATGSADIGAQKPTKPEAEAAYQPDAEDAAGTHTE